MEADWEFEVGSNAPVIEAIWPGFVDLRKAPEQAHALPEGLQISALAHALEKLNGFDSPVWTSKCDVWTVGDGQAFDAVELDAAPECTGCILAAYIDLLPRLERQWSLPKNAEALCRNICARLKSNPLRCCRIDLIVRRANLIVEEFNLGITAYITACGSNETHAENRLADCLAVFASALCAGSTLQS